jgi:tRNA C32,U32 (ribose-2'-O)-methylase TrmJ
MKNNEPINEQNVKEYWGQMRWVANSAFDCIEKAVLSDDLENAIREVRLLKMLISQLPEK